MKRPNAADAEAIREDVEALFAELDAEVARQPGLLDVLRVYGDYEAAIRQADDYFAALNPVPHFSTTNTSG